jgi:hypothetical protein
VPIGDPFASSTTASSALAVPVVKASDDGVIWIEAISGPRSVTASVHEATAMEAMTAAVA